MQLLLYSYRKISKEIVVFRDETKLPPLFLVMEYHNCPKMRREIQKVKKMLKVGNGVGNLKSGEAADGLNTKSPEFRDPWPFRIKLSSDHIRWDSLKISAWKEFEESVLGHMNEDSRKASEAWIAVNISIYDVDTGETYNAKLAKKESFWFDPMPCLGEKVAAMTMREPACYDLKKAREAFVYSIEPFRQIVRTRNLKYGQEIGLRISDNKFMGEGLEFSVLHSPFLDIGCFRF